MDGNAESIEDSKSAVGVDNTVADDLQKNDAWVSKWDQYFVERMQGFEQQLRDARRKQEEKRKKDWLRMEREKL